MHFIGITENARIKYKLLLKKKVGANLIVFLITALTPIVLVVLYSVNIIKDKPRVSNEISASVAEVYYGDVTGTAFLVSSDKLITASHVLYDANVGDEVEVVFHKLDSISRIGKVLFKGANIGINDELEVEQFLSDFALLEISDVVDLLPLEIGDSDLVVELDEVVLPGYPNNDFSITDGTINSTSYGGYDLFKSNVTANPGVSGGPVLAKDDMTVIGVAVGGPSRLFTEGENIIIKINNVISRLEENGYTFD